MTLLDQATPLCNGDDVNPPLCERCNKPFTARSGSGGKPQRFCSSECRTASHTDSQRSGSQRQDDQQNVGKTPALETLGTSPHTTEDSDKFDWANDEDIVLREQQSIAIYRNKHDGLVIRQERRWDQEEDVCIIVTAENIDAFIDRLTDVAGIPSVGKR
jgi:hypothetical protein